MHSWCAFDDDAHFFRLTDPCLVPLFLSLSLSLPIWEQSYEDKPRLAAVAYEAVTWVRTHLLGPRGGGAPVSPTIKVCVCVPVG